MRYPSIRRQQNISVTVPALNGGTNLNDDLTTVNDNQLTAGNNMWWHDNALRTRPGMVVKQEGELPVGATGNIAHFYTSNPINEREAMLGQMLLSPDGLFGVFRGYALDTDGGVTPLGRRTDMALEAGGKYSSFGVKASRGSKTDYYFFLSSGDILQQGEEKTDGTPRELVTAEPYVPTVLVNGHGVKTEDELLTTSVSGNVYENYNMLTTKFYCTFTTDGKSAYFKLPHDCPTPFICIEITLYNESTKSLRTLYQENKNGAVRTYIENIQPEEMGLSSSEYSSVTLVFTNDRWNEFIRTSVIGTKKDGTTVENVAAIPAVASNNLVLTLDKQESEKDTQIQKMTRCTWFGGDRSGVGGGTRLFVTGNPDEPNLVHWSDVNNPLYFPENNHAYIGDGSEAVTGFGKQGDILVIFKEHEIYYAQYVAGDDADYEYAKENGVEITTYMAKFPITPLHSTIGCDCPDSIRLVNNRLIWADSTGRVYMLPTVNQYSERNVREISPNIRPLLRQHSKESLKRAVAGEYCGYYTLLVDNKLYLLDTQNSAFVSFNYYSKENEAQRALPWYVWTLDPELTAGERGVWAAMVSDGDQMRLLRQPEHAGLYGAQVWKVYDIEGETDEGEPIECSFTSKLFDFGRKDMRKAIMQLYIGLADTPESSVRVSYITDEYTAEDAYTLESNGDHAEREPGHMRVHRLTPSISRVRLFGIRCDSEGAMAVDGIQIKTKPQGVVR